MGMPITLDIQGIEGKKAAQQIEQIFDYFKSVDKRFSTYKKNSEITKINQGLPRIKWSSDMKLVMDLCALTKTQTHGYFDINNGKIFDPSGLVKGWSINNAANMLKANKVVNSVFIIVL